MKYTANYNLKKPEGTDTVNIDDFNNNADILDAEINSINEQIDTLTIQDDSFREQINNLAAEKAELVNGKVPLEQLPNLEVPVKSVNGKIGAVVLTKSNIGLGNVDNTADNAKVVLSATKLVTPRAINGVNFDGSAPITITDSTKAPTSHASTGATYGAGTTANYGHCKIINDLAKSSIANGEALSAYQGYLLNQQNIASYLTFCANVNADSLDSAFGKNNNDRVVGIGRQLAMYAWFKGTNKTSYPFTNLLTCNTLLDCINNASALNEMFTNAYIMDLIDLSPYAESLMDAKIITGTYLKTLAMDTTNYYAGARDYLNERRTEIMTVLDSSTTLFSKVTDLFAIVPTDNVITPVEVNTNTIIMVTRIGRVSGGSTDYYRTVYDGLDSTYLSFSSSWNGDSYGTNISGLTFRGMRLSSNYPVDDGTCAFTYTKYTAK